tara:strand:- start:907 stop:1197 length:291 start_codon:yes stop_codon:yes gene_type:complete
MSNEIDKEKMKNKITLGDVADMLSTSEIPPEVDYRIEESSTKGCVAIVYFYEDELSKEAQKTVLEYEYADYDDFVESQAYANTVWGDAEDDKRGGI